MSHVTLIQNGYRVVAIGKSYTAYQLDNIMIVKFENGTYKIYEVENG
jgi:hypothetical protein